MIRERFATAAEQALLEASLSLPEDVVAALENASRREEDPVARAELATMLENLSEAKRLKVPICQDTGTPVFYVTLPNGFVFTDEIYKGIAEGVRRATKSIPLRPNSVDPCTRENYGDNLDNGRPVVHIRPGPRCELTVLPKGGGGENVSKATSFFPSEVHRIKEFVLETMCEAGGRPCPPVILGVGIGGTFDQAPALAKEALLEPLGSMDPFETELFDAINALGIGPMGLGGNVTCLGVKVNRAACHTSSLPVAVNFQCWVCRRATVPVEVE